VQAIRWRRDVDRRETAAAGAGPDRIGGTVPLWQWIGDDGAVTFSY
jgi:hypothetical protein